MSIEMIKSPFSPISGVQPLQKTTPQGGAEQIKPGNQGESFKDLFSNAIHEVDKLQVDANKSIENLMTGKGGITTHDTMIALEKADAAFQLMNNIRAKIIKAYEDVIRTQV